MVQYIRGGGGATDRVITVNLSINHNPVGISPKLTRHKSCLLNPQARTPTLKTKNSPRLHRSQTTNAPHRKVNTLLNPNIANNEENNHVRYENIKPQKVHDEPINIKPTVDWSNIEAERKSKSPMGAGGGRHGHCYTEVHIPPTPHMGVQRLNTLPEQSSPVLNQEEANRRFTITLKPGQYRVNVQWKSKSQPFRITLAPREKSPSISTEGPPPLEQQPLFYCAQTSTSFEQPVETHAQSQSQSAPSNISSLPKRLVHRLLYRPTSSTSPFQQCLHSSQNSSYSLQPNVSQSLYNRQSKSQKDVKTKRLSEIPNQPAVLQAPPNSPNCSCRKGQKRGWDGGPKHRSRKSRYRLAERKKSEGNELYKKKDYREALKLYSKAIEICPDCAAYYSNRSACNMMLGRYNDALADALQAVKLDSTMIKGYIRVGKCHVALGDATAALSILKQASELEPANQSIRDEMNSAQTLLRHQDDITKAIDKKDFRTAIFHLDRALEVAVGCVNLKIVKAENLAFLGRYQEAQVIVNEILQFVSSNNADAIYVRGLCLYYQENQDSAFNHFQQVLRLAPDHQKAKEAYKKAKSLKLKKDEGNKAYVSGNLSEAYSLYTEALGIDVNNKSTNSKLYFNRATVASKLNKMEEAVNDCTAAINLDDGYVKAYLRRAKCYQALEQHEEAVRDFEKVFKLDHNQENKRLLQDAKTQLKISKQKDYYKILGVSKTAGEDEIKKSYRKKALVHHPDRHANSSEKEKRENEVKFKEIGEAYAILTDPKKRAAYDRGQDVNDLDSTYCNADEIFAQFFGNSQHFGGFHSPEGFPGRGGGFGGDGFPGGFHFQFN